MKNDIVEYLSIAKSQTGGTSLITYYIPAHSDL